MKMEPPAHPSHSECTFDCCAVKYGSREMYELYSRRDLRCPAKNTLPCGCTVEDYYAPLTDSRAENFGMVFKSKCSQHAPKVDSRKADTSTAYAFTLTMPPDYKHSKPIEEVARLICENGMTSKPYERAEKWAYVIEHTAAGVPHVHGMYKMASGRRIEKKYFKRYWPLWDEGGQSLGMGFKGGYHQKARHEQSYDAYIQKEGVVHRNAEKLGIPENQPQPSPEFISHA